MNESVDKDRIEEVANPSTANQGTSDDEGHP